MKAAPAFTNEFSMMTTYLDSQHIITHLHAHTSHVLTFSRSYALTLLRSHNLEAGKSLCHCNLIN